MSDKFKNYTSNGMSIHDFDYIDGIHIYFRMSFNPCYEGWMHFELRLIQLLLYDKLRSELNLVVRKTDILVVYVFLTLCKVPSG